MALAQHELLLFAAAFFALGLLDELAVDMLYLWLKVTGRARTGTVPAEMEVATDLSGPAAVFIPAWQEDAVIGLTLAHAVSSWRHDDLAIFVGCYRNDPATLAKVEECAAKDGRIVPVIVDADGPTSKAHCLNVLWSALRERETATGRPAHMVVLHDAEDMVDPAELTVLDRAVRDADFVQLPVLALPLASARWIGGHYSDEFAESHAKTMVVRNAIGASVPGAGVGSAIGRAALERLADTNGGAPFAEDSLTEDYELGQRIAAQGGTGRFLRVRTESGRLVATRAYFPERLDAAVRQKTRWTHGIALQGWDRLGWQGRLVSRWMMLRDRKGPLAAALLALGYVLVGTTIIAQTLAYFDVLPPLQLTPVLKFLLLANLAGLLWRCILRGVFTANEYGWREGFRAIPRVVLTNMIAIISGWRAMRAYMAALGGAPIVWEKTEHAAHPTQDAKLSVR
ncbi:glycosyl transferase family protein [Erythrobacter litoralis]|nr:glycosyl transferase family protein [Erythrobacter litoralis]